MADNETSGLSTPKEPPTPKADATMDPSVAFIVQLATTEVQVIWRRYAGFLVLHGFIINGLGQFPGNELAHVSLAAGGLFSCVLWYVLNFCGWLNQNIYLAAAYRLMPQAQQRNCPWAGVVDDTTTEKPFRKPDGTIYALAQALPVVAGFGYAGAGVLFLVRHMKGWTVHVSIPVIISAFVFALTLVVTNHEFKKRSGSSTSRRLS